MQRTVGLMETGVIHQQNPGKAYECSLGFDDEASSFLVLKTCDLQVKYLDFTLVL